MPLTPPDPKYCQCEVRPAHSFMTLGPRPKARQCKAKPKYIIAETKATDGEYGTMTLCPECKDKFIMQTSGRLHEFIIAEIITCE